MTTDRDHRTTLPSVPRVPRLERSLAMRLAADEYTRFADALDRLDAADWTRPTPCPAWDVRRMGCHVVGMGELAAGIREGLRQQWLAGRDARRRGTDPLDALTELQVREREDWSPERVVHGIRDVGPRAARGRRRTPGVVRRRRLPGAQRVNGRDEAWTVGFLTDVILTRDTWMHRMDLAAATGRGPVLTADHDAVIVADVVAEWAERHGRPHRLTLTGPAGGSWGNGGGEPLELDAVEFCRTVSGRGAGQGLLATQVPF